MCRLLARTASLNVTKEGSILIRVFTDDDFKKTLNDHGSPLVIIDAETLKYG